VGNVSTNVYAKFRCTPPLEN